MFFLLELGLNFDKPAVMDNGHFDLMDFIKLFFILCGFSVGFLTIYLMMAVAAENNASAGFQQAIAVAPYIWGTIFFAMMAAMVVYYVWWVPTKLQKMTKEEHKRYDEQ